ncbi:hypothetical protein L9F63_018549, partial [Diploptera punctata]
ILHSAYTPMAFRACAKLVFRMMQSRISFTLFKSIVITITSSYVTSRDLSSQNVQILSNNHIFLGCHLGVIWIFIRAFIIGFHKTMNHLVEDCLLRQEMFVNNTIFVIAFLRS